MSCGCAESAAAGEPAADRRGDVLDAQARVALGVGGLGLESLGLAEAEQRGNAVVRLDTGVFMLSAQKIYEAAGFVRRGPYPGAEPPEFLQPYWIYMERSST